MDQGVRTYRPGICPGAVRAVHVLSASGADDTEGRQRLVAADHCGVPAGRPREGFLAVLEAVLEAGVTVTGTALVRASGDGLLTWWAILGSNQ